MGNFDLDPSLWATAIELIEEIRDKAAERCTTPITSIDLTTPQKKDAFEKLKIYFRFLQKSENRGFASHNSRTEIRSESQKDFPIALQGDWRSVLEQLKRLETDRREPYNALPPE